MRNPSFAYAGPPPVSLAEALETLSARAREVSEDDADLALAMARGIREEAAAADVEARRRASMERRVEERERARRLAEAAARERADAETRAAALRAGDRDPSLDDPPSPSRNQNPSSLEKTHTKRSWWTSLTRSSSSRRLEQEAREEGGGGGGGETGGGGSRTGVVDASVLARRAAATKRASSLPVLFDVGELPDEVVGAIMRRCGDYEVASFSCAAKRFNELAATDDGLWGALQRRAGRHPRWPVDGSWRAAFLEGARVDAQWRRSQFARGEHRVHSEYAQCVDLRGDVAASGSADHTLAILGLPPRTKKPPPPPPRKNDDSDEDPGTEPGVEPSSSRAWEGVLARCVGHSSPVTCCRLAGPGGRGGDERDEDGFDSSLPPTTLVSSTRDGDVRVWDLRGLGLDDPWGEGSGESSAESSSSSSRFVGSSRGPTHRPPRLACVASRRLATPGDSGRSQPHSHFFDLSGARARGASSGSIGLLAAAGDHSGDGVHVYDPERWGSAVVRLPAFDASCYGVAWGRGFRSDENVVHAACDDGRVRRWDIRSPSRADASACTGLARGKSARCVASDGGLFAFGSAGGTVHVHDARRPSEPLAAPERAHASCVNCVAMDYALRRVVSGGDDCGIRVRRLPLHLEEHSPAWVATSVGVLSVAFDHSRMAAVGEDVVVRTWDAVLGEGFVDRDALQVAMRELNRRLQGTGAGSLALGGRPRNLAPPAMDWHTYRGGELD